jgi:hypothetical protein
LIPMSVPVPVLVAGPAAIALSLAVTMLITHPTTVWVAPSLASCLEIITHAVTVFIRKVGSPSGVRPRLVIIANPVVICIGKRSTHSRLSGFRMAVVHGLRLGLLILRVSLERNEREQGKEKGHSVQSFHGSCWFDETFTIHQLDEPCDENLRSASLPGSFF